MQTLLTNDPFQAATMLRSGRLVCFPTETVYGLGADAFNEDAVGRIFAAKMRPLDNPLIVHVSDPAQVKCVARHIPPAARTLIEACFPGPLSVVLPKAEAVPSIVTAGLDTVAVRMPDHDLALTFLEACNTPVAAPSANLSGRPSPTSWEAVCDDLSGRVDCLLKDGRSAKGLESTVVDCTDHSPGLLRAGAVSVERLLDLVPALRIDPIETVGELRSPGIHHPHYAPRVRVEVVERPHGTATNAERAYIGIDAPTSSAGYRLTHVCESTDEYAYCLFDFFRRAEAAGVGEIHCQRVMRHGLGRALMDRLEKAASSTA